MDAGLAKVLNSTVGTKDFESLDKILNSTVGTSNFRSLDKVLYGNKALVPSSTNYFKIGNFDNYTVEHIGDGSEFAEKTIVSMKMWTEGGFNISGTVSVNDNSILKNYAANGGVSVYRNGALVNRVIPVKSTTAEGSAYIDAWTTGDFSFENIYFSTGDVIDIKLYCALTHPGEAYNGTTKIDTPIIIKAGVVDKSFDITYAQQGV